MKSWTTLARRTVLHHDKFLTVELHTIALPDGSVLEDWPWLVMPEYVIVVPVTADGVFLCFRQTKYGVAGTTLAPVGGYLEPDERPLDAAKRELLEETGYTASSWRSLGSYTVDGNRGAGTAHLFLARDAEQVAAPDADDLEEQVLLRLSRDEVARALHDGAFKVLAWTAAVSLALGYEDERPVGEGNVAR
ncbi:MAG: NUDIX hydrolase [Anaerolineae bacterium]